MRLNKIIILNILLVLFLSTPAVPQQNDKPWEYSRTLSGIKIFHRAGVSKGLFEFLAITSINTPPEPIARAVLDIPTNYFWMADCVYSENITKISADEIIAYYITAPPWPVSKRDSIIRIKAAYNSGKRMFTMSSLRKGDAEKYKSLNPDCLRIYEMEGTVTLEEISPGSTEVKFFVAGESGGNVPDFIVSMGGWVIPYKTLSGLKKFMSASLHEK